MTRFTAKAIDMRQDVEHWIAGVENRLYPILRSDARLKDAEKLIGRFADHVQTWRSGGQVRTLVEDVNELAAAAAILQLDQHEVEIFYEPRLTRTRQTIDFLLRWPDGSRSWVDVKTVAPQWADDDQSWARFERLAGAFPDNASLVVSKAWCGAAMSGQEIKARWSFIQRTAEVERKIALLTDDERGPVRLLLCSNGGFHKDGLEDFADFYFRNRFREDDWSRNAVARYLDDDKIVFARSLDGFCYLKRAWDSAVASELVIDVRGPREGA